MNNKILTLGLLSLTFEVSGCKNTSRQALLSAENVRFPVHRIHRNPGQYGIDRNCSRRDSETDESKIYQVN